MPRFYRQPPAARVGRNNMKQLVRRVAAGQQAEADARSDEADITRLKVRNQDGEMIDLSAFIRTRRMTGPYNIPHYNMYKSIAVNGNSGPGYSSGQAIAIHEFLYPLIQGYDSVELEADVELGGTDQKFNLLMGRQLQEQHGQKPQVVLTMPILEGLDGVQKMSKSLNNYVGIADAPDEMFGRIMSISDELMWRYYELLSFRPMSEINQLRRQLDEGLNPRDVKVQLAQELIARFHTQEAAVKAHENFVARFRKGDIPDEMPELTLSAGTDGLPIANLLKQAGLNFRRVPSRPSAARTRSRSPNCSCTPARTAMTSNRESTPGPRRWTSCSGRSTRMTAPWTQGPPRRSGPSCARGS